MRIFIKFFRGYSAFPIAIIEVVIVLVIAAETDYWIAVPFAVETASIIVQLTAEIDLTLTEKETIAMVVVLVSTHEIVPHLLHLP